MKLGLIGFDHFKISCVIGNNEEEKISPQDIFLDLRVQYDFLEAARSDSYEDTICYVRLATICEELVLKKHYNLLETFANDIIEALQSMPGVTWSFIKIKKPSALTSADFAIVELEGGRKV